MKIFKFKFIFLNIILINFYECKPEFEYNQEVRSLVIKDDIKDNQFKDLALEKEKFLCISLGFNCTPALNLEHNNLRKFAFPFDWNITSFCGLCDVLDNGFIDFLNPKYLDRRAGIFNSKYNIAFAHDFPVVDMGNGIHTEVANYLDYLEDISSKYQRRIERFYNVFDLADSVYFFRAKSTYWKFDTHSQNKDDVIKLRNILMQKFPEKKWILVVIDTSIEYKTDWRIPNVKNFYISDFGKENEWKNIFRTLGLID